MTGGVSGTRARGGAEGSQGQGARGSGIRGARKVPRAVDCGRRGGGRALARERPTTRCFHQTVYDIHSVYVIHCLMLE